jgi:hypothetical protein
VTFGKKASANYISMGTFYQIIFVGRKNKKNILPSGKKDTRQNITLSSVCEALGKKYSL